MAGLGDGIKYGKFSPSAVFSGEDAKEKKISEVEGSGENHFQIWGKKSQEVSYSLYSLYQSRFLITNKLKTCHLF